MSNVWKRIYHSSFGEQNPSSPGHVVTVGIYRLVDIDESVTDQLIDLPFEEPLVIEWDNKAKEEVVCGSTATLRIICNNDREFVPLMISDPQTIRLYVTDSNDQIWQGLLDMQQCEEPYSTTEGYVVELTFSDFGILDRIPFSCQGLKTGTDLLNQCVNSSTLIFTDIIDYCSTKPSAEQGAPSLSMFTFDCRNFYDEDGEPKTVKEVLEGALQPLALKVQQFGSKIWCYDLNSLLEDRYPEFVEWHSTDHLLSFDKYVNKARIKYSTYCNADVMKVEMDTQGCTSDDFNEENINLSDPTLWKDNPYYSLFPSGREEDVKAGDVNVSYTLYYLRPRTLPNHNPYRFDGVLGYNMQHVHPMHISSMNGGVDADGFCALFTGNNVIWRAGAMEPLTPPVLVGATAPNVDDGRYMIKMEDVYIPPMQYMQSSKFLLRIRMEMCIDPRYNPFEAEDDNTFSHDAHEYANKHFNHTFKKLLVQLRDADGNVIAHYSNAMTLYHIYRQQPFALFNAMKGPDRDFEFMFGILPWRPRWQRSLNNVLGGWYTDEEWASVAGDTGLAPYCYLDYYSYSNIENECGTIGFQCNKQCVGSMAKVNPTFSKMEDGQYIPYPHQGGYIHIEVMNGYVQWPNKYPWWPNETLVAFAPNAKHVYYKLPTIEIVRNGIRKDKAEYDDIETQGYVNKTAYEELTIDTLCGSSAVEMPSSLGCIRISSNGLQLKKATRAGHTDTLENLLLSTLYSQYHGHKKVLSGTASNKPRTLKYYYDDSTDGAFMMTGAVYDVKAGTTYMTLTELSEETYEREDVV